MVFSSNARIFFFAVVAFYRLSGGAEAGVYEMIEQFADAFGIDLSTFTSSDASPDSFLSTPEIATRNQYPAEVHTTVTDDGYILELHRIPHENWHRKSGENAHRKHPILLLHGFTSCSGTWISNNREDSLGFILADENYDVWMGNVRGNRYNKRHTQLSPEDKAFWNFNLDDYVEDLRITIDYILNTTGSPDVSLVGHSMGCVTSLQFLAAYPEYNKKIAVTIMEAPTIYFNHMTTILRGFLMYYEEYSALMKFVLEMPIFFKYQKSTHDLFRIFCTNKSLLVICKSVYSMLAGYSDNVNVDRIHVLASHFFTGASWNAVFQFYQMYRDDALRYFDYGKAENLRLYSQDEPPNYELGQITSPIVIFWSYMDSFSPELDTQRLAKELNSLHHIERIAQLGWNHADFILARNLRERHYNRLLEVLENVRSGNTTTCDKNVV